MGTSVHSLLFVALLSFACGAPAHSQDAGARHGLWAGFGFGYGLASFSCDSCSHGPLSRFSLSVNLGVTPSPHVRLGVGGDLWENGLHKGPLPTTDTWTVFLSYYPRIRGGPYVEAGVGFSHYGLEHGTGDPLESVSSTESAYAAAMGWGYTLGVGWELNNGSLIRVTYAHGNVGTLHGGGTGSTGWKQNLLLLGIEGRLPP
jgi:hypothetical protein